MKPQPSEANADANLHIANAERGLGTSSALTLHVPFSIVKRGGRKQMILPPGATDEQKIDNALVKALARAFRCAGGPCPCPEPERDAAF